MHIGIVAPDDWTIWLFYRHLIGVLQREGAQVTAITGGGPYVARIEALGVDHITVPYARFVDPSRDVALYRALRGIFSDRTFDIVQNITIKANLYGAHAAKGAGVREILNTVEGAGLLYSDPVSVRVRAIRALAEVGLRSSRRTATRYWFVNERDRDVFVKRGLADADRSVVAIATGVDTSIFDSRRVLPADIDGLRREVGIEQDVPIVANVAGRLLRSKGIAEFIDAARILKESGIRSQFVLVGPEEPGNPDAFDLDEVRRAVTSGIIRWLPFREDISTVYAACTVAVVPSYYAEGTPKGVMEGMAMARPVVCADIPSIRALVSDEQDGVLVKPRSGKAIAGAVALLLQSPHRRAELGTRARNTATTRFDAEVAARIAVDVVYGGLSAWRNRVAST